MCVYVCMYFLKSNVKLDCSMSNMASSTILALVCFLLFPYLSHSFPLSTSSRWIIDENSGNRVKLACVNWPGHLHAMIPEGLNKKPMKKIVADISSMGFNCVRLTWATHMYTQPENANITVAQSLDRWDLTGAKEGVGKNNPDILGISVWDAQKSVIDELGAFNVMVVLDNHVSLPKWCCGFNDGNGFFGDEYFDPAEWVQGLTAVARRYKGNPTVVAMSMRNELRGARQNINDWYKYMQEGAKAIHDENPDLLIIFSGLRTDKDLTFLKNRPLTLNLHQKLVFEAHWYSFGESVDKWLHQTNEYCATVNQWFMGNSGFLFNRGENSVPLFLSEFGIDQRGLNERDNRYFNCILGALGNYDLDWALWHLAGSFMLREGKMDVEDFYAIYDKDWDQIRNTTFLESLRPIQVKFQDPKQNDPTLYIIYHPQSGKCMEASSGTIFPTPCQNASKWTYTITGINAGPISLSDSGRCLSALGPGLELAVANCSSIGSLWTAASRSKNHLAIQKNKGNNYLCMDWDSSNSRFVTNKCLCLDDELKDVDRCEDNPQRQWFKLVPATRD